MRRKREGTCVQPQKPKTQSQGSDCLRIAQLHSVSLKRGKREHPRAPAPGSWGVSSPGCAFGPRRGDRSPLPRGGPRAGTDELCGLGGWAVARRGRRWRGCRGLARGWEAVVLERACLARGRLPVSAVQTVQTDEVARPPIAGTPAIEEAVLSCVETGLSLLGLLEEGEEVGRWVPRISGSLLPAVLQTCRGHRPTPISLAWREVPSQGGVGGVGGLLLSGPGPRSRVGQKWLVAPNICSLSSMRIEPPIFSWPHGSPNKDCISQPPLQLRMAVLQSSDQWDISQKQPLPGIFIVQDHQHVPRASFLLHFLSPAAWSLNVMAGTLAAILGP
nr:uncharacterized protein LOC111776169 [Equus caballus]